MSILEKRCITKKFEKSGKMKNLRFNTLSLTFDKKSPMESKVSQNLNIVLNNNCFNRHSKMRNWSIVSFQWIFTKYRPTESNFWKFLSPKPLSIRLCYIIPIIARILTQLLKICCVRIANAHSTFIDIILFSLKRQCLNDSLGEYIV